MKAKYVLIAVVLCMIAIIAAYYSIDDYNNKLYVIVWFCVVIIFWLSTLSIKWIKFLFQIR